jgi:hypothetical protein
LIDLAALGHSPEEPALARIRQQTFGVVGERVVDIVRWDRRGDSVDIGAHENLIALREVPSFDYTPAEAFGSLDVAVGA